MSDSKPSKGIVLCGTWLILSSIIKIVTITDVNHYYFLFHYISNDLIKWRYVFSWIDKIVGLASGIGILYRKDIFRRLAILNWLAVILVVNLKHPYPGFKIHTGDLVHRRIINLDMLYQHGVTFDQIVSCAVIAARLLEITIGCSIIFFLTRPAVKNQFK